MTNVLRAPITALCCSACLTLSLYPLPAAACTAQNLQPDSVSALKSPVLMKTGWQKEGNHWRYYDGTNKPVSNGWKRISGHWYYFDKTGKMVTGWIKDGGTWYYCLKSGEMAENRWITTGDLSYYLGSNGAMATNCWIDSDDGRLQYYVNSQGVFTMTRNNTKTEAWMQAYFDEILDIVGEFEEYGALSRLSLIDISKDSDVPALMLDTTLGAIGMDVIQFINGKAVRQHCLSGTVHYRPNSGYFLNSAGRMGSYSDTVYQITSTGIKEVASGTYNEVYNSSHTAITGYDYYWNGSKVSEQQYLQNLSKYVNKDKDPDAFLYATLSCEEMLEYLSY